MPSLTPREVAASSETQLFYLDGPERTQFLQRSLIHRLSCATQHTWKEREAVKIKGLVSGEKLVFQGPATLVENGQDHD